MLCRHVGLEACNRAPLPGSYLILLHAFFVFWVAGVQAFQEESLLVMHHHAGCGVQRKLPVRLVALVLQLHDLHCSIRK